MKSEGVEITQKLLSIAHFERSKFFKLWNALERSDFRYLEHSVKIEKILNEWSDFQRVSLSQELRFISAVEPDYPRILLELPQPPLGLFLKGSFQYHQRKWVSVVGSRKPTPYSLRMTRQCVKKWIEAGMGIISGGALGLDAEAHRSSLDFKGQTYAVLGGGLFKLYPKTNQKIFEQILVQGGCLISEYPPLEEPKNYYFPERNRIIAALGHELFLAQAHKRSGSLGTARAALELGRDIYVLRPPPGDENFAGSFKLIELGARSLASPADLDQRLHHLEI